MPHSTAKKKKKSLFVNWEITLLLQLENTALEVVNGIPSLTSLSDFSLLAYRNTRDILCYFISCNFTVFIDCSKISSSNFLVESLGFSVYSIMSSAERVLLLLF